MQISPFNYPSNWMGDDFFSDDPLWSLAALASSCFKPKGIQHFAIFAPLAVISAVIWWGTFSFIISEAVVFALKTQEKHKTAPKQVVTCTFTDDCWNCGTRRVCQNAPSSKFTSSRPDFRCNVTAGPPARCWAETSGVCLRSSTCAAGLQSSSLRVGMQQGSCVTVRELRGNGERSATSLQQDKREK